MDITRFPFFIRKPDAVKTPGNLFRSGSVVEGFRFLRAFLGFLLGNGLIRLESKVCRQDCLRPGHLAGNVVVLQILVEEVEIDVGIDRDGGQDFVVALLEGDPLGHIFEDVAGLGPPHVHSVIPEQFIE